MADIIMGYSQSKALIFLLMAFLIMPLIFTAASYFHNGSFHFLQIFQNPLFPSLLTFLAFYLGAIFEELGWTSYATPLIQKRLGIFKAGLLIGFFGEHGISCRIFLKEEVL